MKSIRKKSLSIVLLLALLVSLLVGCSTGGAAAGSLAGGKSQCPEFCRLVMQTTKK